MSDSIDPHAPRDADRERQRLEQLLRQRTPLCDPAARDRWMFAAGRQSAISAMEAGAGPSRRAIHVGFAWTVAAASLLAAAGAWIPRFQTVLETESESGPVAKQVPDRSAVRTAESTASRDSNTGFATDRASTARFPETARFAALRNVGGYRAIRDAVLAMGLDALPAPSVLGTPAESSDTIESRESFRLRSWRRQLGEGGLAL
ncbi:MAG: hypothetical protein FJ297_14600 [Planctomycetes bacterium]|nr:hypothetical protein [Planctomycetota bacterium]